MLPLFYFWHSFCISKVKQESMSNKREYIKYTKEDLEKLTKLLKKNNNNITKSVKKFCEEGGVEYTDSKRRAIAKLLNKKGKVAHEGNEVKLEETEEFKLAKKRKLEKKDYYIIGYEQNKTPLHKQLYENILAYKEFLDAEFSVILGRYKNPTSVFSDKKQDNWNEETKPYWSARRHDIHKYLTILADVKIQPTAVTPLASMESLTGVKTSIIGHPKMHLKSVPVLEGYPKKILITTGAITKPNYTDSKSGKRGEFTHKLGFVIVEVRNKEVFHIRQVEADKKGNFIDLCHHVTNGKVKVKKTAQAIVLGDTHIGELDPKIDKVSDEIIKDYKIKTVVHHDLANGESVNNHITKDPIQQYHRYAKGEHLVREEIEDVKKFLSKNPKVHKVIVQSNHNDRYDRWIVNQDWRKDIANSLEYLKYAQAVLEGKAPRGVLAYILEEEFGDEITCLGYDDSFKIGGIELAHHGHLGSGGSRGSLEQFRKLNTRVIIGHSHTMGRVDNAMQVGTSSYLRVGFNKGASSWMHSHAIIHSNNIAQQILFVDGEYTTFK